MQRLTLREPGDVADRRLVAVDGPSPVPAAGQVRLRVLACGVCHTDLHIVEGELDTQTPRVPGHQVVGIVDAVGEGVRGVDTDDRVGVGWLGSTCGACDHCRAGRENLCERATFTGRDVDGGYAEEMLADARYVYPLPDAFSDVEAAPLLCAGIIGYRTLTLSQVPHGGKLGLFGFGASAHLTMQVALSWECEVFVFTRSEDHRRLARELGAAWTGRAEDDPGVGLHAAVSFAPVGWMVPAALSRLERGGTLVVNAVHATDIPSFPYDLLYGERVVRSVANYTREDARAYLAVADEIGLRVETETYALGEANRALARLKRGEVRGAAVVVP